MEEKGLCVCRAIFRKVSRACAESRGKISGGNKKYWRILAPRFICGERLALDSFFLAPSRPFNWKSYRERAVIRVVFITVYISMTKLGSDPFNDTSGCFRYNPKSLNPAAVIRAEARERLPAKFSIIEISRESLCD